MDVQKIWGDGIVMARRVMDLCGQNQIFASSGIADNIRKLSHQYKSIMHPIGKYKIKHDELRRLRWQIRENLSTLTDSESQVILDKLMAAEKKLHEENTQLIAKLKNIISPRKIILLKAAEEGFNRKLFEEYRKKRHGGGDKRK